MIGLNFNCDKTVKVLIPSKKETLKRELQL